MEGLGRHVAHPDVVGVAVDAARVEGHDDGGPQPADLLDDPSDHLFAVGVHERARLSRPVLHPRVAVAQEDRLLGTERGARTAQLGLADLGIHRVVAAVVGRATLVAVGGADQPDSVALLREDRHRAADAERLVVGVGEDREQPGRVWPVLSRPRQPASPPRGTDDSSCSPSSTVRRYAAQTASESTVRSRPDSSSWRAAALVPPGRRDHVAQLSRVHPARLREERAALERLDDEVVGDVAREAEVDRGVDQRLHHEEHVGRAAAADRGRHRDELLVVDLDLVAERPQQRARLLALLGRRLGRRVPDGHPAAEARRRVGHAPHDLAVAEEPADRRRRRAGEDREHELAVAQAGPRGRAPRGRASAA